jgi:hypothetical protein
VLRKNRKRLGRFAKIKKDEQPGISRERTASQKRRSAEA